MSKNELEYLKTFMLISSMETNYLAAVPEDHIEKSPGCFKAENYFIPQYILHFRSYWLCLFHDNPNPIWCPGFHHGVQAFMQKFNSSFVFVIKVHFRASTLLEMSLNCCNYVVQGAGRVVLAISSLYLMHKLSHQSVDVIVWHRFNGLVHPPALTPFSPYVETPVSCVGGKSYFNTSP